VYETSLPIIFNSDKKGWSATSATLNISPGQTIRHELPTRGRSFIRLYLKRSDPRKPSAVNVVVSYR
jgi:hypothetical protein